MDKKGKIELFKQKIARADVILIGASNGLSIAEGYNIFADNETFRSQFGDFKSRYGLRNVLDGVFSQSMTATDRMIKLPLKQLTMRLPHVTSLSIFLTRYTCPERLLQNPSLSPAI